MRLRRRPAQFTRDEWLDVVLRSVGLEPAKLSHRVKLHFIARLAPLVEANYNFIELGPARHRQVLLLQRVLPLLHPDQRRPGDQGHAVLQQRPRRIGLVGFWDTVAFDEVAGSRSRIPTPSRS
jgi:ATP-dependent Lon protease